MSQTLYQMVYDPENGNALILGISRDTEPREVVQYSNKLIHATLAQVVLIPIQIAELIIFGFFLFQYHSLIVLSKTNRMIGFCGESISICFITNIFVFIVTTCVMIENNEEESDQV